MPPPQIRKQTDSLSFQSDSGQDYNFDLRVGWRNDTGLGQYSTQNVNGESLWFFSPYLKLEPTQQLDYKSCREFTGYREGSDGGDRIPFKEFSPGDRYCILTDENRVALETFTSVSSTKLVARVVVYEPTE